MSDEALFPEIGPERLNRELEKYIWGDKPHLHLNDLWEYLNRYTYLPRLKNRETLVKAVRAAIEGMLPGPFAYAERWDDKVKGYAGLAIDRASNAIVTLDSDAVVVRKKVAEENRPTEPTQPEPHTPEPGDPPQHPRPGPTEPEPVRDPTRFFGTVALSADRPARDMTQIVEAIIEQLTTIPGAEVSLKLEIDAEVRSGIDRSKIRTLVENANTLGFLDKSVT